MFTADRSGERGFTLVELMMAVTIGLIVMGLAMGGVPGMLKTAKADSGLAQAAAGLRAAREMSVGSRRNVRVTFGTNTIINTRVEFCSPTPCTPATTVVRTTTFEGRTEFRQPTGVPTDTSDNFGFGSTDGINLGTLTPAMFTTDGSFVNSNGDILNGTIFIGIPGDPLSIRAISIFGPTGALHLWKWNGRAWVEV
jgi:prepilin-type N-terminal cleavage/methylation domain-containing protein